MILEKYLPEPPEFCVYHSFSSSQLPYECSRGCNTSWRASDRALLDGPTEPFGKDDGTRRERSKRDTSPYTNVEDLDIRCERLAVRHTCFGVAVQDFVYIYTMLYVLIPHAFAPIHSFRGSATNVNFSPHARWP